jgi:hypothetical protein
MSHQNWPNWQKITQSGHHEVWLKFFYLKIVVLKTLGLAVLVLSNKLIVILIDIEHSTCPINGKKVFSPS